MSEDTIALVLLLTLYVIPAILVSSLIWTNFGAGFGIAFIFFTLWVYTLIFLLEERK